MQLTPFSLLGNLTSWIILFNFSGVIACNTRSSETQGTPPNASYRVDLHTIEIEGIKLNFIDLPEVSETDVAALQSSIDARGNREHTSIRPMPKFRAAEAKTPIGLYHAVMGRFPDLTLAPLIEQDRLEIIATWAENLDLPLTYTTTSEDIEFSETLSRITGRHFTIMNDSQNEYSIRGRHLDPDGQPTGAITSSIYFFGDDASEVPNHAFIQDNPLTINRPHGVHEIPTGKDHLYKNSFGLIHPIGNVWSRSIEGITRGAFFLNREWHARSSFSAPGRGTFRTHSIGSRLAENISH